MAPPPQTAARPRPRTERTPPIRAAPPHSARPTMSTLSKLATPANLQAAAAWGGTAAVASLFLVQVRSWREDARRRVGAHRASARRGPLRAGAGLAACAGDRGSPAARRRGRPAAPVARRPPPPDRPPLARRADLFAHAARLTHPPQPFDFIRNLVSPPPPAADE